MFRHLDDPAPPVPDDARLRWVLARAAGLRSRRRRGLGAVALAVLTVAVALRLVLAPGGPGPGSASQTAYQFDQRAYPPPGSPVPTTSLTDVVFTGPRYGFALAEHRARPVLAVTTDGGAGWSVVGGHLPVVGLGVQPSVQMEFTSRYDGYLWAAPAPDARASGMWRTADGGVTWQAEPIGPVVYDVSAIGSDVWALVGACPPTGGPCALTVKESANGGATWAPTPRSSLPGVAPLPSQPASVELARVSPLRSYVLSLVPGGPASLLFTADGGDGWSPRPVPCAGPFGLGAELALSSTGDLWMICGGQASAGEQAKALYRSSTGGSSWTLAAQTPAFGGAPGRSPGVGAFPLAGYVEPYSIGHKNLAVVSARRAWLFPTRGTVLVTADGGAGWAPVPGLEQAGFGSGAPGNVTFISASEGWVTELGVGLWTTPDGTTWHHLGP